MRTLSPSSRSCLCWISTFRDFLLLDIFNFLRLIFLRLTRRSNLWHYLTSCYKAVVEIKAEYVIRLPTSTSIHLRGPRLFGWSHLCYLVSLFFVTHVQMGKINFWNGPAVHVFTFMLAHIEDTFH